MGPRRRRQLGHPRETGRARRRAALARRASFGTNPPRAFQPMASSRSNGSRTVGHLVFNNAAANYTLSAGSGGTFDDRQRAPQVGSTGRAEHHRHIQGSHTITAPIALASGVSRDNRRGGFVDDACRRNQRRWRLVHRRLGSRLRHRPNKLTPATRASARETLTVGATGGLPATTNLTIGGWQRRRLGECDLRSRGRSGATNNKGRGVNHSADQRASEAQSVRADK